MKTFDLGKVKNGFLRNLAKMWNLFAIWKDDPRTESDFDRIKRDKDSHSLVEMRKNMHERYPYLTSHVAVFRDFIELGMIVAIVYLIV